MKIKTAIVSTIAIALLLVVSGPADAGPYTDDMSKCLVRSTDEAEKNYLVKWMFVAMASHPEVRSMASITEAQRDELSAGAAKLFQELLTERCRTESRDAMKYEGQAAAIQASFSVLGSVAASGLTAHPDVAAYTARLAEHIDEEKLEELMQ